MKFARRIAQFLCTAAIVFVGFYAVTAACIAFFIATGSLTPGDVMFSDSRTPTLASSLAFCCGGLLLVAALGFVRKRLLHHNERAA